MKLFRSRGVLILFYVTITIWISGSSGKVFTECEAVRELQRAGASRSFISNWVCLMKSVSNLDSQLKTGPYVASSFRYGIFQITSSKWCTRGVAGGLCKKKCEDFVDDNIQDDIVCARKIQNYNGFQAWDAWQRKCKNKPLPNISVCRRR